MDETVNGSVNRSLFLLVECDFGRHSESKPFYWALAPRGGNSRMVYPCCRVSSDQTDLATAVYVARSQLGLTTSTDDFEHIGQYVDNQPHGAKSRFVVTVYRYKGKLSTGDIVLPDNINASGVTHAFMANPAHASFYEFNDMIGKTLESPTVIENQLTSFIVKSSARAN